MQVLQFDAPNWNRLFQLSSTEPLPIRHPLTMGEIVHIHLLNTDREMVGKVVRAGEISYVEINLICL